jgi:hypothetical protein
MANTGATNAPMPATIAAPTAPATISAPPTIAERVVNAVAENVTNTNATTSITSTYVNAADNVVLYEELEDADCEACKL